MSKTEKILASVVAVVVVVILVFVFWPSSTSKTHHKATCWTPAYARANDSKGIQPAPRHGRGALGDVELCYTGK